MRFRISGRIYEKESGTALRGLIVRAYDEDLLYDDLLGSAVTDDGGRFEIVYDEKDFSELFENRPDIYLSIYAPPLRHLLDTRECVRWNASADEEFDIAIPHGLLEPKHTNPSKDIVEGRLNLSAEDLVIKKKNGFDVPKLRGFGPGRQPGAPALLEQRQYVALPRGASVLGLKVTPGDAVRLSGRANPMPIQPPVWDVGERGSRNAIRPEARGSGLAQLDGRNFQSAGVYPAELATLGATHEFFGVQFLEVTVRPLQFDSREHSFIFYPDLRYEVKFDYDGAVRRPEPENPDTPPLSIGRATMLTDLLQAPVVRSASDLLFRGTDPQRFFVKENIPHVIITDDFQWPKSAIEGEFRGSSTRSPHLEDRSANPVQADADGLRLVDHFKRLAKWKTARGMRSRVVTISEIVDGKWGDFTQDGFALDLQEVIRNFIKFIHEIWATEYVLLGGDVSIVPMRYLCGIGTGWMAWDASRDRSSGTSKQVEPNPPNVRGCYVFPGGTIAKINTDTVLPEKSLPVYTQHGGVKIPFDLDASPEQPGWYFTSKADFEDATKTAGFARLETYEQSTDAKPVPYPYVIVEGPNSLINDDFYWMPEDRPIPSDFYYSSIVGSCYGQPGKHDFDVNGNGLYGQFHWNENSQQEEPVNADFNLTPDVWVGRVPAETGAEARAFVDKILTYEKLTETDGRPVDFAYLQRMLFGADYWLHMGNFSQNPLSDPTAELKPGWYTHQDGSTVILLQEDFNISLIDIDGEPRPDWRLLARFSNGAQVEIPYQPAAGSQETNWAFAALSAKDQGKPTKLILVEGPKSEITPSSFVWEPVAKELGAAEKDALIAYMKGWFPEFTSAFRHYADFYELEQQPPAVPLASPTIRAGLDGGPHFVSLTGHGGVSGCCQVDLSEKYQNRGKYFIAFANSCSTAEPDSFSDSLGEQLIVQKHGAVAYVGNSRIGLIGIGDNFEEFFWCAVRQLKRVGPAAGLRLATESVKLMWTFFAQLLYGDPEMSVWTTMPKLYQVTHEAECVAGGTLVVRVRDLLSKPLSNHTVTLLAGWDNDTPSFFKTKETSSMGKASFKVPTSASLGKVSVVVSHQDFKPYIGEVKLIS